MARQRTNPADLWRAIEQAGSIDAYVDAQLVERGFKVSIDPSEDMSKRQYAEYKKSLKAEAAERKQLKSAAWSAYRSQHIVHLGDGVFWNDFTDYDRWDLENAEARAAENELPKIDSPQQLAQKLNVTIPQLRWLAYHRDAATHVHYRRFTIAKRGGAERPIWAPLPQMKQAQHWILYNIAERLPVHGAAHGFLAGRSILTNAQVHGNAKTILKMDLKDFFPTVTVRRVKGVFRHAGYREQVATLLAQLCTEAPREVVQHQGKKFYVALGPRCLPQGAPTSPALTNTICLKLDSRLTGLASKYGWRYTRYADDLTFSLPNSSAEKAKSKPKKSKAKNDAARGPEHPQLGTLMGLVKRTVADEGFRINDAKTRIVRSGSRQKVTGLVVNDDLAPRVPRVIRKQIRAAIHNLKQGKSLREGETMDSLQGMIAFIGMTDKTLAGKMAQQLREARAS